MIKYSDQENVNLSILALKASNKTFSKRLHVLVLARLRPSPLLCPSLLCENRNLHNWLFATVWFFSITDVWAWSAVVTGQSWSSRVCSLMIGGGFSLGMFRGCSGAKKDDSGFDLVSYFRPDSQWILYIYIYFLQLLPQLPSVFTCFTEDRWYSYNMICLCDVCKKKKIILLLFVTFLKFQELSDTIRRCGNTAL